MKNLVNEFINVFLFHSFFLLNTQVFYYKSLQIYAYNLVITKYLIKILFIYDRDL